MNACRYIRALLLCAVLLPLFSKGQTPSIISNVPINEINIRAFRHFHQRFPSVLGESWAKLPDGYIVSFMENSFRHQAHFDQRGGFLCLVKYYEGKDLSRDLTVFLGRRFPDYSIGVVTEITDGEKTFYRIKIENASFVKTLSICDGQTEILEEWINGGVYANTDHLASK